MIGSVYHLETMLIRLALDARQYDRQIKSTMTTMEMLEIRTVRLGRALTRSVTVPLALIGGAAVYQMGKFDKAMTEAEAIAGGWSDAVRKSMEEAAVALALSGQVAFDPAELAGGLEQLAAAGFNAKQSVATLPIVAKFAQAGVMDLEQSVKLLSGTVVALGRSSEIPMVHAARMREMADQMVFLANATTTSVRESANAMSGDAAAAARIYGMEVETLTALLGGYAKANVQSRHASNMLGRAVRLMTAAYGNNEEVFKRHGIVMEEGEGKWTNFIDVVRQLEEALAKMPETERPAFLKELGLAALSQKAILPLIGQAKAMAELEEQAKNAGGVMDKMANQQMESFINQAKLTLSSIKAVAIDIGQKLIPALTSLFDWVKNMAFKWRQLDESTRQNIVTFGAYVAAIGPVILVTTKLIAAVKSLNLALLLLDKGLLKIGVSAVASKAGLVVLLGVLATLGSRMIGNAIFGVNHLNEELRKSVELGERWKQVFTEQAGTKLAELMELPVAERRPKIFEWIQRLNETDIPQMKAKLKTAMDELERQKLIQQSSGVTGGELSPTISWIGTKIGYNQGEVDAAASAVEDLKMRLETYKNLLGQVEEASESTGTAEEEAQDVAEKLAQAVEALQEKFKESIATVNMSTEEIEIWRLEQEYGKKAVEEFGLAADAANVALARSTGALRKSADDLRDSLIEQINTYGMTATEAEVYRIGLKNLTAEELRFIKESEKVLIGLDKTKELFEEGKRITESMRDPLEKFAAEEKRLNELLRAGKIDLETYTRAWVEARKEIEKPITPGRVEAISADSVAGLAALDESLEWVRNQEKIPKFEKEALAAAEGALGGVATDIAGRPLEPVVPRDRSKEEEENRKIEEHLRSIASDIRKLIEGGIPIGPVGGLGDVAAGP